MAGRNNNNFRYTNDITLMEENKEELESLLMKVKEESGKAGLKLKIQKTKIMAPGSITSWQIDGETMETTRDFIFLGSKTTVDGDCSHESKRIPWRKSYDKLKQCIRKQRLHFAKKVYIVKAMVFPVVVYGCEIWTIKKAEH